MENVVLVGKQEHGRAYLAVLLFHIALKVFGVEPFYHHLALQIGPQLAILNLAKLHTLIYGIENRTAAQKNYHKKQQTDMQSVAGVLIFMLHFCNLRLLAVDGLSCPGFGNLLCLYCLGLAFKFLLIFFKIAKSQILISFRLVNH